MSNKRSSPLRCMENRAYASWFANTSAVHHLPSIRELLAFAAAYKAVSMRLQFWRAAATRRCAELRFVADRPP
jgi:hypothetical protein